MSISKVRQPESQEEMLLPAMTLQRARRIEQNDMDYSLSRLEGMKYIEGNSLNEKTGLHVAYTKAVWWNMVIYGKEQIVDTGKFQLNDTELIQLWRTINDNNFFELEGDYRMAIGYS